MNASELIRTVECAYRGLGGAVRCGLAVFGTMAFKDRKKPLSIIYESPSGYGKSAVIQMFFPVQGEGLEEFVYRCDKFTPKAFVSHATNISEEKLAQIDLLPKLKNKVLLTKELAPIFRGREDELKGTFATLIAILDGKGFTSNSGARGKRGYEEDIVFNWLGATTPLPRDTHRLMYQLGTRLLIYEVPVLSLSEDELFAYARREDTNHTEKVCQLGVNEFLVHFFSRHRIGSVSADSTHIPDCHLLSLTRWATLLANGRAGCDYERDGHEWKAVAGNPPEGPFKIINYFKELARGSALADGRNEVGDEDITLCEEVCVSSIPGHLRPLVRQLRRTDTIDSPLCEELCRVSRPTARRYLKELSLLRIVDREGGSSELNDPDSVTLAREFQWLQDRTLEHQV